MREYPPAHEVNFYHSTISITLDIQSSILNKEAANMAALSGVFFRWVLDSWIKGASIIMYSGTTPFLPACRGHWPSLLMHESIPLDPCSQPSN
jgi:hypothetical protein